MASYSIAATDHTLKFSSITLNSGYSYVRFLYRLSTENDYYYTPYMEVPTSKSYTIVDGEGGVTYSKDGSTTASISPSTEYVVNIYQANNSSGTNSVAVGSQNITTDPASATIIICGFTTSSISLRLINATKGYWYWRHRTSGGSYPTTAEDDSEVSVHGGLSTVVTFPNLTFGNLYDFKATFQYYPYPYTVKTSINCAPSKGDPVGSFSHQTWNLMVDSVNAYRGPANWETTTGYTLTATQTRMPNSPPYTLTAARFNQLWYNLQQLRTGMANDFPVATNSSTSGAGSEYHVFAYRFYDASEWCLNDGLERMA